jgi:hypothetical protein
MTALRNVLISALSLSALCLTSEATARRTVIDQGEFIDASNSITACTIGLACSPITLPFSFDFGTGTTDLAYVYDRGIVSFGDPIPLVVDANADFTTFGVPVIAPLYVPGDTGTAGPYEAFTGTMTPDPGNAFQTTLPNFGSDLFIISFLNPADDDPNSFLTPYVHLILDASPDELRFEFIHGQSFFSDNVLQIELPSTTGTQMGYSLGDLSNPEQFFQAPPNIEGINAFTFPGGVPEPATWAMMILGFGIAGLQLRRRKSMSAEPQPA